MPRLSIIIPALGDWEALETTLVAVLRNQPAASEVVVALNRPYDDPYRLRDEVRFLDVFRRSLFRRSRLVELINAGFAAARGEVVHVLTCGAKVGDGWVEPALRHFSEPQTSLVAPFIVDQGGTRVVTAGCAWSRGGTWSAFGAGSPLDVPLAIDGTWVGPEVFAGFYRRTTLFEVGTFDATLPDELSAIDLGLRVRRAGGLSLLEPECRVEMSGALIVRPGAFNQGWHGERLFWRHLRGGSAVRKLASHAFTLLFEAACVVARPANAARVAGRMLGVCDPRQARTTHLAPENSASCTAASADRRIDDPHSVVRPQHDDGGNASAADDASSSGSRKRAGSAS